MTGPGPGARTCVDAGDSASTDPFGDAVALWVALHGLAHQRAVIPYFPWPDDTADRLVDRIAQLGVLRTLSEGNGDLPARNFGIRRRPTR